MSGSGSNGRTRTVLVYEFVCGGGLIGRNLPPSWLAEGAAIRRALVEDFAALPGVQVVTTVNPRVPWEPIPGVEVIVMDDPGRWAVARIAERVDYTVAVAPESDAILLHLSRALECGGHSIGCDPWGIGPAGHKDHFARLCEPRGIPTPPTLDFAGWDGPPDDWPGPFVIKPVNGAGAVNTFVVAGRRGRLPAIEPGRRMIAQPYLPGTPMSASFLVDDARRAWPIAVGRQRIEVDGMGRVHYLGGTIPSPTGVDLAELARPVDAIPGLRGFVGVDFLDDGRGSATILEVNPRPTTSYVGLSRLLPPGTIAGAWLAASAGSLEGTGWPERLRAAGDQPPVTFGADGSIRNDEVLQ